MYKQIISIDPSINGTIGLCLTEIYDDNSHYKIRINFFFQSFFVKLSEQKLFLDAFSSLIASARKNVKAGEKIHVICESFENRNLPAFIGKPNYISEFIGAMNQICEQQMIFQRPCDIKDIRQCFKNKKITYQSKFLQTLIKGTKNEHEKDALFHTILFLKKQYEHIYREITNHNALFTTTCTQYLKANHNSDNYDFVIFANQKQLDDFAQYNQSAIRINNQINNMQIPDYSKIKVKMTKIPS